MVNKLTKDSRVSWPTKKDNMNKHIPDNGYTKSDAPLTDITGSDNSRSFMIKNECAHIAYFVYDNKRRKIEHVIELSQIDVENNRPIFAYCQKDVGGYDIMVIDINKESLKYIDDLYNNKREIDLTRIYDVNHHGCILKTILYERVFEEYGKIITGPTTLRNPKLNMVRRKVWF